MSAPRIIGYFFKEGLQTPYGSAIPTMGHAATAFDAYRYVYLGAVEDRPASWAMTDIDAAAALGRLVDGPISERADIERAENALRALLLHEHTEVLVPVAKLIDPQMSSYVRMDAGVRNAAAFAAMNAGNCIDRLIAIESITQSSGVVTASSRVGSMSVGTPVDQLQTHLRSFMRAAGEMASALPLQVGAATFFSSPEFTGTFPEGASGFIDQLYNRMYRAWMEMAQSAPPLHLDVKLPPLTAIVLSRVQSRDKIPDMLHELRQELQRARDNLNDLNKMLEGGGSQADLVAQTVRLTQAFDAIVPEAMLTDAQRWKRRFVSVFNFAKPVRHAFSIAADPLSLDPKAFAELFKTTFEAVASTKRIVNRSVAAAAFGDLLQMEPVRGIVTTHFTTDEISRLAAKPK